MTLVLKIVNKMTLGKKALSTMILVLMIPNKMTLSAMTLVQIILSKMTFHKMSLRNYNTQQNNTPYNDTYK